MEKYLWFRLTEHTSGVRLPRRCFVCAEDEFSARRIYLGHVMLNLNGPTPRLSIINLKLLSDEVKHTLEGRLKRDYGIDTRKLSSGFIYFSRYGLDL
ncbi:hypothetical protein J4430_00890 [Candidatus Woesearchaeota archaeon]|nr:hypothetical protein [Candidatus Woesearchaeota archaeon]